MDFTITQFMLEALDTLETIPDDYVESVFEGL
jgi:hypothetical protein